MRDGVSIAKLGIPAVALVTDEFWPQADFVAESLGMPDVPRVRLPHPVAGTGVINMQKVAAEVAPAVIQALEAKNG